MSIRPPGRIDLGDVVLRRWTDEDASALYAAVRASQEALAAWMPWAVDYTQRDTRDFLRTAQDGWRTREAFLYAIDDGEGAVLGACGLHARVARRGLEIGYWVHTRHTGYGIATRAAAACTRAGLAVRDRDHVDIQHDAANRRSEAIPARLGFVRVGVRDESAAPRGSGQTVTWRLDRSAYASSNVPAILADLWPEGTA